MHVVATAGHVDHGKSTLVRVLTGTDPDRFAEEKERGLTIDLGFASTQLASGREVAFVDVPGHVRFIKNMLAGVGAVDACVFVVAATEGWKPQSEEHLRILELLGVRHGLVALTNAGVVDSEWLELARMDVTDRVRETFLDGAPIVAVDSLDGRGVDDLRSALDALLTATPTARDVGRPRLWVDRSFAARGSGTVVTGTLTGGALHLDDEVALEPSHRNARVRGLQTLHRKVSEVGPGHRVAVNLAGVAHTETRRGDALIRASQWSPTRTFDADLHVLASLDHEVSRRGAFMAYVGSGEHPARVRVLGTDAIAPGGNGFVRLHLPVALPLLPGDRFVLRESGRGETVGGGEVLDVAPVRRASRARPDRSVDRVVAERGWVDTDELERLTGERRAPTLGRWVVAPAALEQVRREVAALVDGADALGLDIAVLSERQRLVLDALDDVVVDAGRARRGDVEADRLAAHPFLAKLEAEPFTPPSPAECGVPSAELRELVRRGLVVERDGAYFGPSAVEQAARRVAGLLAAAPEGVTVADVRDALGTTRKHVLPLLAHLDATGVTRRRGDLRIPGPRLPT